MRIERVDVPELLDLGEGTPDDVRASLRDLWRINRYLGGIRALTTHLFPRLRNHPNCTIVDVGAGSAEIALLIVRWSKRHNLNIRVMALDFSMRNLAVAHDQSQPDVRLIQADAGALPFSEVDYIISSLFLHHFSPEQVVCFLRESYNRARCGLIMTDLVRGYLPLIAFKMIQPVFARSYITRYDGAVSVRRAYTPAEFSQMALAAGMMDFKVHTHFPWRMTLVADKS